MDERTSLLRAIAANHRAFFRRYAGLEGGAVERIAGAELILGARSATLAFPPPGMRSGSRLDQVMGRARALGIGRMSCWSLDEDNALGTRLIARGFGWGWQPHWMAMALGPLQVGGLEHDVVPFERGPALPQRGLPYADVHSDPPQVRHLSVREDGVTVGHVMLNPWRRIGGIYSMGVAESHRRRGIGRSLTIAACRMARELGCTHAVLNATPDGELLYRAVGFESLGKGRTWWLHAGPRPTARQRALVEAIGLGGVEAFAALRPTRAELGREIPGAGVPLAVAAVTGRPEVADWILSRRPELVSRLLEPEGGTLLHLAVERDDAQLAQVALAHGADRRVRDGTWNGTPLGWAQHLGRTEIAALLSRRRRPYPS